MLMLLPPEIREKVLEKVDDTINVRSACKQLRPKQASGEHPTHTEQRQMIVECGLNYPTKWVVPFDNAFLLQLYRIWKTPHTHNALVHWARRQQIHIDEGGLYATVPWRCTLYNTEGVQCLRMRVQLWDRVNRSQRITLNRYGDTRTVWRLLDGTQARAYMPVAE